ARPRCRHRPTRRTVRPRRLQPALRAPRGNRLARARGARLGAEAGSRWTRRHRGDRAERVVGPPPGRLARARGCRPRSRRCLRPPDVARVRRGCPVARPRRPPAGGGGDLGVVEDAVGALRAGQVVVLPTDTVYGLAATPYLEGPARKIFRLKRRPETM